MESVPAIAKAAAAIHVVEAEQSELVFMRNPL
jgi:hypothetical protein